MQRRPRVPVLLVTALAAAAVAVRRRPVRGAAPREGTGLHRGPVADRPVVTGPVQGRPRFVLPSGSPQGTVPHGSPAARGIEQEVELPVGRTVVGRGVEADLRLTDPTVSPVHVEVLVQPDGQVLMRDLETENGIRVDGWPVLESPLVDSNRVQLGDAVLLFQQDLPRAEGREGGEFG